MSIIGVDFVSGLTLWLSLAQLPAGAIPLLFSCISNLFVHYLGRHLPLGAVWLSLAELPGGGEGASSAVFLYV